MSNKENMVATKPVMTSRINTPMRFGILQRKCACGGAAGRDGECEECKQASGVSLQRHAAGRGTPGSVSPIVHEVLRSPGRPMDAVARSFMEPRFGHDFGKVRIHTDERSAESARSINAMAYTVGHDVVFGSGLYRPESTEGKRLLAHELTHVMQQSESAPQLAGKLEIGPSNDSREQQADRTAEAVSRGQTVALGHDTAAVAARPTVVQRQTAPKNPTQPTPPPAKLPPGVEDLKGRDFDRVFRLDTISVIDFRTDCCLPCEDLAQWMSYLAQKYGKVQHPFRVRFYSVNAYPLIVDPSTRKCGDEDSSSEADESRALGKRLGVVDQFPQIRIYAERDLAWERKSGPSIDELEQALQDVIDDASSSGALKGAKAGLHLGLGEGVAGWLATGLLLPVALIGAGIGAIAGAIAGNPRGTKALSPDRIKQVTEYLGKLQKDGLQGDHSLARDAVAYWSEQDFNPSILNLDLRRRLIKEMLVGFTGDYDERAIIKILENSSDSEITEILNSKVDEKDRVSLQDLVSNIQGSEFKYFMEMLQARFPLVTTRQRADIQQKLLIDDPVVLAGMKKAYANSRMGGAIPCQFIPYGNDEEYRKCTQAQKPEQEQRECGAQIVKDASGAIQSNPFCADPVRDPTYELKFPESTLPVLGSFHTHPYLPGYSERRKALFGESPSTPDIVNKREHPGVFGAEDYIIGILNTYVILPNGIVQIVGKTSDLLGVPAIKPPAGISTSLGI